MSEYTFKEKWLRTTTKTDGNTKSYFWWYQKNTPQEQSIYIILLLLKEWMFNTVICFVIVLWVHEYSMNACQPQLANILAW